MRGKATTFDIGKVRAYQYAKVNSSMNHVDFLKLGVEVAKQEYKSKQAQEQFVEGWSTAMNSKVFTLK